MRTTAGALFCLIAALIGSPGTSPAATSKSWDTSGYTDLLKGRLSGLSLTADGMVQLGPSVRWSASLGQPALWGLAVTPDGTTYAATGHSGKVFRLGHDGKPTQVWNADQSEIFAIAVDSKGTVVAGSSPNGGIYRLTGGQPQEIWHSPAKYIWAIQPAPDGSLFVGTGEGGSIYKVDDSGKAEVYYETRQGNVTSLALGPNGKLYAGTEPNGIVYEITGSGRGTVLFDSNLPEIRAIAVDNTGVVYAAAMGGAVASRTTTPSTPAPTPTSSTVVSAAPTVITVTEAGKSGGTATPADNSATITVPPDQSRTPAASGTTTTNASGVTETPGVEKSAIYRISPDRTVETVRSSKEDNVYDLLLDSDSVLISTDDRGRIFRLRDGRTTLVTEWGDGEATRLIKQESGFYAALSNPARVVNFGSSADGTGWYQSQVHDAGSISHWGHLQWMSTNTGITFRTRTGNSARPDETWSSWSNPITDPAHALIASPVARFIQWRAEWPKGNPSVLSTVSVPFLPQNGPPVVRSVTVSSVQGTNPAKQSASASSSSAAYSITVTDTGEAPPASASSTASQAASRLQSTQTQISWQADDPDSDKLVYAVYFRAEDATNWQLIRNHMFENTLLLDPDVFADGRYLYRVVASDSPANAAEYARQSELVSTPVLVDNTPPALTIGSVHRTPTGADLEWDAVDKTSPLRRCEYSVDTGLWQPVEAVDGITDSPSEHFRVHVDQLRPGEHMIVIRAYDAANNAGLARVILH